MVPTNYTKTQFYCSFYWRQRQFTFHNRIETMPKKMGCGRGKVAVRICTVLRPIQKTAVRDAVFVRVFSVIKIQPEWISHLEKSKCYCHRMRMLFVFATHSLALNLCAARLCSVHACRTAEPAHSLFIFNIIINSDVGVPSFIYKMFISSSTLASALCRRRCCSC